MKARDEIKIGNCRLCKARHVIRVNRLDPRLCDACHKLEAKRSKTW